MLFSYKFFTFSQPFSQFPNKFYIKKSTSTHRKFTTIHTKPTTTPQKPPNHHPHHHNNNKKIRDQREKDWEIEGKRDRSRKRDQSSAATTRSVLGGDNGAWPTVGCQDRSSTCLVGAWLAIGEVGLGCLWIDDEGRVDRWWLAIDDEGGVDQWWLAIGDEGEARPRRRCRQSQVQVTGLSLSDGGQLCLTLSLSLSLSLSRFGAFFLEMVWR